MTEPNPNALRATNRDESATISGSYNPQSQIFRKQTNDEGAAY